MDDTMLNQVSEALQRARQSLVPAQIDPDQLNINARDAYQIGMSGVNDVAAWKIGGANPWSRKFFGIDENFFGPLSRDEVVYASETLSLAGLYSPLAEPEIALRVASDGNGFDQMSICVEVPASVLPDLVKSMVAGQIADRAGAGALWIAQPMSFDGDILNRPFAMHFQKNDDAVADGESANVIGGPLSAAKHFLDTASTFALPVQPGHWIATGALCPAVPIAAGDTIRMDCLGWSVALRFD